MTDSLSVQHKEDILLTLGEPDGMSDNELRYSWDRLKLLILIPGLYSGVEASSTEASMLTIRFDQNGFVTESFLGKKTYYYHSP